MSSSIKLIQIVPIRRTEPEGVGHYARILAEKLAITGVETIFIAPPLRDGETKSKDAFKTIYCKNRTQNALLEALTIATAGQNIPILLHASAYGYQKRGIPFWLVGGLRIFLQKKPTVMVTYFHELFAQNLDPRHSSFWLGRLQKYIAKNIQTLSTKSFTSNAQYAKHLRCWQKKTGIEPLKLPVFSTVGEPDDVPPFLERDNTLVIFGRKDARKDLFSRYRNDLGRLIVEVGIDNIVDIGAPLAELPDDIAGRKLQKMGFLEAHMISKIMTHSRYGALAYPADLLCKSTIFAAHAAHGQTTFVFSKNVASKLDNLCVNGNYIQGNSEQYPTQEVIANCSNNVLDWYNEHRSENAATILKTVLFQNDDNMAVDTLQENHAIEVN